MAEKAYRLAPPGFTRTQWDDFMEEGFLVIENGRPGRRSRWARRMQVRWRSGLRGGIRMR